MVLFWNKSWNYRGLIIALLLILSLFINNRAASEFLSGTVNKGRVISESGTVLNKQTGKPIAGAKVSIPSANVETRTNQLGKFQLDMPDKKPLILSVKASGYKPFSLIIDESNSQKPMEIGIEQTDNEVVIDTRLHHLGDNNFSERSANATDFSMPAAGPFYFQEFFLDNTQSNNILLKIGSIIGIDTMTARELRQSRVLNSSSSPVKVFFNSHKVGEINFNGNNHIFRIPVSLLRTNSYNHVRIETGVNLNSGSRTDYDDIEFINLMLEFH